MPGHGKTKKRMEASDNWGTGYSVSPAQLTVAPELWYESLGARETRIFEKYSNWKTGSSWTSGTPGQQLEDVGHLIQPPRLSPLGTAMMIAFGGPGWRMPRRSVGVSPSPKNSLSTMMGSIIQGATSSRPHPHILIGYGPRGPGMFRAVMTDPERMRGRWRSEGRPNGRALSFGPRTVDRRCGHGAGMALRM
jgi:hypothetical protein